MVPGEQSESETDAPSEGDVGSSHSRTTPRGPRSSAPEAMADTIQSSGAASGTHLAAGALLEGTYRVERLLGKGAMGAVYLVEHVALGTKFAAKVVATGMDAASMTRLRNEARMASAIDHEHIVRVTHLGQTDNGNAFVVMERLHGEDLRARTVRHREEAAETGTDPWLPDREVRGIVAPLLSALDAAHAAGVVHRDLKPENVFLHERQGRIVPKIVDFGIGKLHAGGEDVRLTATGQIVGTPLYMAPEQSRSSALVDHRSDIYAMGVMLFELCTGRVPFEAQGVYEIVVKHVTEAPPDPRSLRPDLPEPVAALLLRCLAKDPEDRFQSAAELAAAWEDAWGLGPDVPVLAAEGGPRPSDPEAARRPSGERSSPARAKSGGASKPRAAASAVETAAAPAVAVVPARSRRPWVLPVLAATVVFGAGIGTFVALRDGPPPADPPAVEEPPAVVEPTPPPVEPLPEPPPVEAPAAPAPIVRRIESRPEAEVLRGGAVIGRTPLDLELPDGAPVEITLRAGGRPPLTRTITADDDPIVQVTLQAAPRTDRGPGLAPQ